MRADVRVEAMVTGRKKAALGAHPVAIELEGSTTTLRVLIAATVAAELEAFRGRREEQALVGILSPERLQQGLEAGAVRSGGGQGDETIEVEPPVLVVQEAVDTALLAFEDGLYKVVVDDHAIASLDDEVVVEDGLRLLFVRLTALTGGWG